MKMRKMYEVRYYPIDLIYSREVGYKGCLLPRSKALRVVKFLKKRGIHAFIAPLNIAV